MSAKNKRNVLKICFECIIYIQRTFYLNFVIFSKFVLDKTAKGWYISLARVGGICGFFKSAHCDDAGDCSEMR